MARIISQLLALSAVVLALSLVVRKVVLDKYDPYRCRALRDGGRWLDRIRIHDGSIQPHHWQPPGCILHDYNAHEIESCLDCNRILFAGDSTARQLFWAAATKVNKTQAEHTRLYAEKHGSLNFEVGCSKLQFLWDPYLNSSALQDEIVASGCVHHKDLPLLRNRSQTTIVIGGGLWHARYLGDDYRMAFKSNIDTLFNLSRSRDALDSTTLLGSQRNLLLFIPVLSPDYDMLDEDRNATLTPERLSTLNIYLLQPSVRKDIEILWSFSSMLQPRVLVYEENGIHLLLDVVKKQADIILNLRCNAVAALQHYPFDKTCCTNTVPYNMVQAIMLVLALLAISLGLVTGALTSVGSPTLYWQERMSALIILSLACIYCFLADRTHLFEKLQKTTDQGAFLWMLGFIMILGALTMSQSKMAHRGSETVSSTYTDCSTYLSREQTEEWKGWMQFAVLLYHYFGMSKVLWVYQLIRLMVASYLFMTGFGHAIFFLRTSDFSLRRVAAVLMRLNILSVVLAYGMRTDYNFYYFPALSSFWFLVIYLTMRFWGWRKASGLEMAISLVLVKLAIQRPGVLEKIVKILHSTCLMHIDVDELRFRISLDMYIVYVGMLSAIAYVHFTHASPFSPIWVTKQIRSRQRLLHSITIVAASTTIALYGIFAFQFPDKYAYNKWHAVISPFPILAFMALRNATQLFRTYHSWLFAWLGRCSLETFVLQYHIWLAADTKGLLSLGLCRGDIVDGPCGRWCYWVEFVIITVFFLWSSWGVSIATNVLAKWIVGPAQLQGPLFEAADKVDERIAITLRSESSKLGLKFRLVFILAILGIGNWMWE
jgi:hypothetical protein